MAKDHTPTVRNCNTSEVHERLLREDPEYLRNRVASENFAWARRMSGGADARTGITVIPVVVHVVAKTTAQNISAAQIDSQMAILNKDFRKTNSDIGSIPSAFAALATDARIEFVLATTDPAGGATDGIVRVKTTKDSFTSNDDVKRSSTGGSDAWPANTYLNMWVCQLAGGLLGYAQFPGGTPATDGVVIRHTAFGSTGTAAAPFDFGRTATHEIGHWLNLRHIWGDDGTGCSGDDFVADTPNCADENVGKPSFPQISCGNGPNGDMFMNYMDYTDDDSMFMFTAGQVARMQACLDGDRPTIGTQKPGPKLKFNDDPVSLKFNDDPLSLKFNDDPVSLKFNDDPKLKFKDDPKLKFADDPVGTLKFRDDPKLKFKDDPKLKFVDDPLQTGFENQPPWGLIGGRGTPAPFVLSTPHHSMAWSRSFPAAHEQTLASYEAEIRQYEQMLEMYEQAAGAGQLGPEDLQAAQELEAEYGRLVQEYRQLGGG